MLGWVKRLFGKSKNDSSMQAARSRPRSATAAVLAEGRRSTAAGGAGPAAVKPQDSGADYDPYNTGKFDRAASWERVRHSHR